MFRPEDLILGFRFRPWDFSFRVSALSRVSDLGFRPWDFGLRVSGLGLRVWLTDAGKPLLRLNLVTPPRRLALIARTPFQRFWLCSG